VGAYHARADLALDQDPAGPRPIMTVYQRQRAHSWMQRVSRRLRRLRGGSLHKNHRVEIVQIGAGQYKRIQFADSIEPARVATALRQLRGTPLFPELLHHQEGELWLRFVTGRALRPKEELPAVLAFFAQLYAAQSYTQETAALADYTQLDSDLRFLVETGVVAQDTAREFRELAPKLEPPRLRIGFDYIDPLPKNFVLSEHGVIGIDVEALQGGVPLGSGLAKLLLRWPSDTGSSSQVLATLAEQGCDLRAQFAWIQLHFLVQYTKQKVLQRKPRLVRAQALQNFLRAWQT
jgi:hypothetical protein